MALDSREASSSDWVSRVVREGAPEVPTLSPAEKAALWQRIDVVPMPVKRQRFRSRRVMAAAVVAALAVGGAGVATGAVFSAHTGVGPSDAEDLHLGGPGERLDPSAPDFADVVEEISKDIPFPSGETRQRALAFEVNNFPGESGPIVSTGAIRLWMAGHALCAWSDSWATALHEGDVEARDAASEVVLTARTWPAITDTDPDMADQSEFAWLPDLERAIEMGRPRAARQALFGNSACMPDGITTASGLGVPR